ncbi:MAG: protein LphA [Legionellales bacterium RIFCSPHIGHO2_12_FULL_35_11]|nr:MAG: protein LphA [Legionellales bacterium RIFCSPHIGHO2_12_FULL_35_11]
MIFIGGCSSTSILDPDRNKLPTKVEGASDAYIEKLEERLVYKGVKVIILGQDYLISVPSYLVFANESPKINWGSYLLLNDIVEYLRQFRKIDVHINGYGCCFKSERRTLALTLARTRAVADYLWSQDIETRLVFTQGLGSDKPIVAYSKCSDASPNSRIEIIFRRTIV